MTPEQILLKHIPNGTINLPSYKEEKKLIINAMEEYANTKEPTTDINLWSKASSLMFDLAVRNLESTRLEGDEYRQWLTTEMNKHFTLIRK